MEHPQLLLFDLGGVLVENVGFDHLNALLPRPLALEDIKTRWLRSDAVRSFEAGGCSSDDFASAFVDEWKIGLSPSAFIEAFAAWPKGLFPGAIELLSHLRRRHSIACLSNSNAIHWQRFAGIHELFDVSLSSHLLGVLKPDVACFTRALKECGVEASRVAFFDDSLINVAAARSLGLRAFQVNGVQELRGTLDAEGWLQFQ